MATLTCKTKRIIDELSEDLSTWRRLLGLTSAQMADRIGVARSTYSKMENGDFSVSAETLILTMQALGLLEKFEEFINPYNSDIGRMQAGKLLAKRIRH